MLTTLCIIFTTEAFYPKDSLGNSKTSMTFAVYTLILSLFTGSFGITKFILKGPLPILPLDASLAGLLSFKFLILLLLNTMFVVRTFCLEASFFTSFRSWKIHIKNVNPDERDDDSPPVRVWKVGSIVNSVFIGCENNTQSCEHLK